MGDFYSGFAGMIFLRRMGVNEYSLWYWVTLRVAGAFPNFSPTRNTPKAFANFSPRLELSDNLGLANKIKSKR
jgi:hypothetical protein